MRVEKAVEYKHSGCNCCQSVLLAFADRLDLPEETLRKLGSGFGAGMGNREGVCGALTGAVMAMDLANDGSVKPMAAAKAAQLAFREQTGAILCRDLKGVDTGTPLCDCDDCVRCAVRVAEDAL